MVISKKFSKSLEFVVISLCLLTVASKAIIPLSPIPFTLQTLALYAIALRAPTAKGAFLVVLSWVILGLSGVPVFTGVVAGPASWSKPTFGYIVGMVVAAPIISILANRFAWYRWLACLVGCVVVYVFGWVWLAQLVGVRVAILSGVVPFFILAPLKITLALGFLKLLARVEKGG